MNNERDYRYLEKLAVVAILLVVGYAFLNHSGMKKMPEKIPSTPSPDIVAGKYFFSHSPPAEEIKKLDTPQYVHDYVVNVINNGSNRLGFPGGEMEGGYLDSEQADMVACFVLELSGRKCPHEYPQEAAMYFSSVCAGCHGNDGKGIHGTYPDLTRRRLLGIEKRMEDLRSSLAE